MILIMLRRINTFLITFILVMFCVSLPVCAAEQDLYVPDEDSLYSTNTGTYSLRNKDDETLNCEDVGIIDAQEIYNNVEEQDRIGEHISTSESETPVDTASAVSTAYDYNYIYDETAKTATITGKKEYTGIAYELEFPEKDPYKGYTVTTIGEDAFKGHSNDIISLKFSDTITKIGNGAFSGCSGVSGPLSLPKGINSIGNYAFTSCSGFFGELDLPYGIEFVGEKAFQGCRFNSLILPDSVDFISVEAFSGCRKISNPITIPASLHGVGRDMFKDCTSITKITNLSDMPINLPIVSGKTWIDEETNTEIPFTFGYAHLEGKSTAIRSDYTDVPFTIIYDYDYKEKTATVYGAEGYLNGDLIIPDNDPVNGFPVVRIGEGAFDDYGFNGRLVLPKNLRSIEKEAFQNCSFTGNLILPDSLQEIGISAFAGCAGFSGDLVIPANVEEVGEAAFAYCSGFNGNLVLNTGLKVIDNKAFVGCYRLTGELIIPNSVTTIGEAAFGKCSGFTGNLTLSDGLTYIPSSFKDCSGLTSLTIPEGVTRIKDGAFDGCTGLTGPLILPSSLTQIESNAFYGCAGITGNLIIPSGVTEIGYRAFYECSGLTGDLTIPNSVTTIGTLAFAGCSGLTGNLVLPKGANISSDAFKKCTGLTKVVNLSNTEIELPSNIENYVWINESDKTGPLNTIDSGVTAILVSNKHILTFDYNDGSGKTSTKDVVTGEKYGELPRPYRVGYIFDGWYTDKKGLGTKILSSSLCNYGADQTVYARWLACTVRIMLNPNDSKQSITFKEVDFDSPYGELPTPSRYGFDFVGWSTDPKGNGQIITSDTIVKNPKDHTLNAQWRGKKCTVTFDPNGGEWCSFTKKEVTYYDCYGELPTPTKEGSKFVAWFTDMSYKEAISPEAVVMKCEDHTVYAKWTVNKHIVSYDLNGKTEYTVPPQEIEEGGKAYSVPVPIVEGFEFTGWYKDKECKEKYSFDTPVKEDFTLYAGWEAKKYTVVYYSNGATGTVTFDPNEYTINDFVTILGPGTLTKEGYSFVGWFEGSIGTGVIYSPGDQVKITKNMSFYAYWVKNNKEPEEEGDYTIVAGQKVNLKETCFSDVSQTISRYVVNNTSIAGVSKEVLTGKKAGTVTVKAQKMLERNKYETVAECKITVLNKPRLKFTKNMTFEGQTLYGEDFFTTEDVKAYGVTSWESSKPGIVEVVDSESGILEAKSNGSAKITAYFGEKGQFGTYRATAMLYVKVPAFSKTDYNVQTGAKYTIAMKNVNGALDPEWYIEDDSVAKATAQFNTKGAKTGKVIVEGLKYGDTKLTAIINGLEYECTVHVTAPEISKKTMTLKVGRTGTVSLKKTKIKKADIVWDSTNKSVATVDKNGKVTALSTGETVIYTEAGGVKNECLVTVK